MRRREAIMAAACALLAAATAQAGDCPGHCHTSGPSLLQRIAPVGGCNPDGRGLFHWWEPDCFPIPCGPDDYCRKSFPRFCWRPATLTSTARPPQPTPPVVQGVMAR